MIFSFRKRLSKKTNYLELLQRGQSALNSVSQSTSTSANISRQGSTSTNSSDNIAAVKKNNDAEFVVRSNCTIQQRKDSGRLDFKNVTLFLSKHVILTLFFVTSVIPLFEYIAAVKFVLFGIQNIVTTSMLYGKKTKIRKC